MEVNAFRNCTARYFAGLVLIAGLMPAACLAGDLNITADGYGPVTVGMSVKEAQRALKTPLLGDNDVPGQECYFVRPKRGHKGVSFMVENGVITHAEVHDVNESRVATNTGIRLGDSAAKVKKIYGKRIEVMEHVYYPGDFYYFVWEAGKKRGIKFEMVGGRVLAIYGGSKSIMFVEGCE